MKLHLSQSLQIKDGGKIMTKEADEPKINVFLNIFIMSICFST